MVNRMVSVHAGICGIGIYAIMLPSSGFSVAHCKCLKAGTWHSLMHNDKSTLCVWCDRRYLYEYKKVCFPIYIFTIG